MAFLILLVLAPLTSALLRGLQEHGEKPLIGSINAFRCEMCSHQCPDSGAYPKCKKFMTKMCKPGPDGEMDGTAGERTSGKGYCVTFFNVWYATCHPEQAAAEKEHAAIHGPSPAPGLAGAKPMMKHRKIPKEMLHLNDKHMEALTRLDASEIFGRPGDPEYLSERKLDDLSGDQIIQEEEEVKPMLPKDTPLVRCHLQLQGPLPFDFGNMFREGILESHPRCRPDMIKFESSKKSSNGMRDIAFRAPQKVCDDINRQSVDQHSKLVNGPLRQFFVKRSHFNRISEEEPEFYMH